MWNLDTQALGHQVGPVYSFCRHDSSRYCGGSGTRMQWGSKREIQLTLDRSRVQCQRKDTCHSVEWQSLVEWSFLTMSKKTCITDKHCLKQDKLHF